MVLQSSSFTLAACSHPERLAGGAAFQQIELFHSSSMEDAVYPACARVQHEVLLLLGLPLCRLEGGVDEGQIG